MIYQICQPFFTFRDKIDARAFAVTIVCGHGIVDAELSMVLQLLTNLIHK